MRKIIAAAFVALMVGACSSIDCPLNNTVRAVYALTTTDGVADTLADTLTIVGVRNDGVDTIFNRGVNVSTFNLPMSYAQPTDVIVLAITDTFNVTTTDTIRLNKTSQPHFESVDCSPSFFHELQGVDYTRHAIDAVSINKSTVDYDTTNPHIYIRLLPRP